MQERRNLPQIPCVHPVSNAFSGGYGPLEASGPLGGGELDFSAAY